MAASLQVGLISDTHGLFRETIVDVFRDVQFIVHAGDVGRPDVLERLAAIAPVYAVFGNVDDPYMPGLAPARTLPVGPLQLRVSHGHELGSPTPDRLLDAYADDRVDIIVYGHTHKSLVMRAPHGGRERLIVNPGAAGPKRFSLPASVGLLTVEGGREPAAGVALATVRIIEIG